jgi:hypothetical protein
LTLLSICDAIAQDTPIAAPSTIEGNTDPSAILLLSCANRAGKSLARYKGAGWAILGRENVFNTNAVNTTGNMVAGSAVVTGIPSTTGIAATTWAASGTGIPGNTYVQSVDSPSQVTLTQPVAANGGGTAVPVTFGQFAYPMPADFARIITDTEWDRGRRWPLIGPRSPQQWQLYKSGLIGVATFQRRWRIKSLIVNGVVGNYFCIDPSPADNQTSLVWEYVATSWCQSAGGVPQTQFLADTDTTLLEEYLIELDARWRLLRRLGLSYSEEMNEAFSETAKAYAQDGGMPVLDMAPVYSTTLVGPFNVPDTGFGGVAG